MNSTVETRLYYFDNLRALAMILGVFFHAALAYSELTHTIWVTADREYSTLVDLFAWFTHLFRMPLFFLIAGFFAAHLVTKKGVAAMLANRAKRVLLPFIIFLPLCGWAIISSMVAAASQVEHKSAILEMVAYAIAHPDVPSPPPSTMHLWFLYYLMLFCLFAWILSYTPVNKLKDSISKIHPLLLIIGFPLVLIPSLLNLPTPYPAPDSFLPQFWAFGFFGLFFSAGYLLFHNQHFLDKCKPYWAPLLILSILAYALYFWRLPNTLSLTPTPQSVTEKLLMASLQAGIACWMTLVCLVLGKIGLNFRNPVLRLLSDSAYWIYLVHLPLLFIVQYRLMDTDLSLISKYGLSAGITLLISLASYFLLVRWTPIGWLLNGHKGLISRSTPPVMTAQP